MCAHVPAMVPWEALATAVASKWLRLTCESAPLLRSCTLHLQYVPFWALLGLAVMVAGCGTFGFAVGDLVAIWVLPRASALPFHKTLPASNWSGTPSEWLSTTRQEAARRARPRRCLQAKQALCYRNGRAVWPVATVHGRQDNQGLILRPPGLTGKLWDGHSQPMRWPHLQP